MKFKKNVIVTNLLQLALLPKVWRHSLGYGFPVFTQLARNF